MQRPLRYARIIPFPDRSYGSFKHIQRYLSQSQKHRNNDDDPDEKERLKIKPLRSNLSTKLGISSFTDKVSEFRETSSNWDQILKRCLALSHHDGAILYLNNIFFGSNLV